MGGRTSDTESPKPPTVAHVPAEPRFISALAKRRAEVARDGDEAVAAVIDLAANRQAMGR
jgi:hypothetical protein